MRVCYKPAIGAGSHRNRATQQGVAWWTERGSRERNGCAAREEGEGGEEDGLGLALYTRIG